MLLLLVVLNRTAITNSLLTIESLTIDLCLIKEDFEILISLGGYDTRFSPLRPGFESRMGNLFDFFDN